ncbi:MAG: hypothetical protein GF347_03015 [Candidatus Moranbacteria bacterium]|nr:hypothetical protein [Candidatus Moranbacteria bacterium]
MRKLLFIYIIVIALIYFRVIDLNEIFDSEKKDLDYVKSKAEEMKKLEEIETSDYPSFCKNQYFPMVNGALWEYDVYYNYDVNRNETVKFLVPWRDNNEAASFEYLWRDQILKTYNLICDQRGILIKDLFFLFGTMKYLNDSKVLNTEGIFMPANLSKSPGWEMYSRTYFIPKDFQISNSLYLENEEIQFQNMGEEEIELFFGRIWARKLKLKIIRKTADYELNAAIKQELLTSNPDFSSTNSDLILTDRLTELVEALVNDKNSAKLREDEILYCDLWFSQKIGLIKSICEDSERNSILLELKRYQIPALTEDIN